jgi:hypothetical protein
MRQRTTEGSRARAGWLLPLPRDATAEGSRARVRRLLPLPRDLTVEGSLGDVEDMARDAEDRAWREASRGVSFDGEGGGRGWGSQARGRLVCGLASRRKAEPCVNLHYLLK